MDSYLTGHRSQKVQEFPVSFMSYVVVSDFRNSWKVEDESLFERQAQCIKMPLSGWQSCLKDSDAIFLPTKLQASIFNIRIFEFLHFEIL